MYSKIIPVLAHVLLVLCLADIHRCATVGQRVEINVHQGVGGRIVGGVPATQAQGKHQCSLHITGWFGVTHVCGCSLYGTRFAITAAHCTEQFTKDTMIVKYGGLNVKNLDNEITVVEVRQHEAYNTPILYNNDYSVLVLGADIKTSAGRVETIELVDSEPADGVDAELTGWGDVVGGTDSGPDALQYQVFQIVSSAECKRIYAPYGVEVTEMNICTKHKSSTGCNGDSGGPLIVGGKLAGIVSWGVDGCPSDTTQYPAAYANVYTGKQWLLSKLQ
ncbi:unnamed protein product [Medioppia subpectinata]|uniref:Peptidase S1 domain-containing protein n=1 Tax=Medioppia subpectinata TaxID=1979941 RepID=A0A7R9L7N7_9ACAR|nr:unnamed protein product [Medioppia subpectinata]CAG2115997.1 unnamed protein product [Medioppia subpectinata]